jgi:GNAT superfamily N-acetyltransferase
MKWQKETYRVTDDREVLDIDKIHAFLSRSYWALGVSRHTVQASIANSLCFGLFDGDHQVGFARAITDRATFAYLADVFVIDSHRGRGLGTWLVECLLTHPDLQGLRRRMLATRDAQGLYRKFGFTALSTPERFMELLEATR